MTRLITLLLLPVSVLAFAEESIKISNIKCDGGWITSGTSKLEVIAYCGKPKYEEVTSGANEVKTEDVFYTVKRKDYIISFRGGKIVRMGIIK